ncbi:MAG: hypothetical protein HOI96_09075 [Rhodospirillaceae bacterium]|jgi:hypothetical protein|nr:hypothetical protein [Rhodospirillaceae bacterium]MBT6285318.1 hypothetical protein [Rhodospirillaceae bacterium]
MTINTPATGFDFSGFNLSKPATIDIRRQAELARSAYIHTALNMLGQRITSAYRSTTELFSFAQRMNQAARL